MLDAEKQHTAPLQRNHYIVFPRHGCIAGYTVMSAVVAPPGMFSSVHFVQGVRVRVTPVWALITPQASVFLLELPPDALPDHANMEAALVAVRQPHAQVLFRAERNHPCTMQFSKRASAVHGAAKLPLA